MSGYRRPGLTGRTPLGITILSSFLLLLGGAPVLAQEASVQHDSGNTAWVLVATALVLFMTIPALALFYGGLVRTKNVLSVLMHCFVMAALVSVVWIAVGYSLALGTQGNTIIGSFEKVFLRGVEKGAIRIGSTDTIPEHLYCAFQMTFAIITPALVIGAFVERMKFSAVLWFSATWLLVVYVPICHMTWGGGWFAEQNVIDFAGGIVVHITAGMAALVACIMVGKRRGYPSAMMIPHNLTYTIIGSAMLWVGWFGFNAGSALAAGRFRFSGLARHPPVGLCCDTDLDVHRVESQWQTERARRCDRCDRRTGRDHPRVGLSRTGGRIRDWTGLGRLVLRCLDHAETALWIRRFTGCRGSARGRRICRRRDGRFFRCSPIRWRRLCRGDDDGWAAQGPVDLRPRDHRLYAGRYGGHFLVDRQNDWAPGNR